ncbi:MAG: universal stress protein [Solirubrobacterales bacterium]
MMVAPFTSILCGVEGDSTSTEAVRQAISLAKPGAALHFIAVYTTRRLPQHSLEELQESLNQAAQLAREAGVSASTELLRDRFAHDLLLRESQHHDLLVLGSHNRSRAFSLALGTTTAKAAHEARHPLLIARQPPGPGEFPKSIVFASDASPGSWAPARVAAGVAALFNSRLETVHVADGTHPERQRSLQAQIAEIGAVTGEEPLLSEPAGHASQAIIETARAKGSSLIVSGRRGLRGIRSLGSVSERVVNRAPCSVLVIPADQGEPG